MPQNGRVREGGNYTRAGLSNTGGMGGGGTKAQILKNLIYEFLPPPPPQRGVLKKGRFGKLVGEPKLQNMIFFYY